MSEKVFLFLLTVLISVLNIDVQAQDPCLNVCPTQGALLTVSNEDPSAINRVVCIDNLTGANFVIRNGAELGALPEAIYSCYSVAVSDTNPDDNTEFDIASVTYTIENIDAELDLALLDTGECGSVSAMAKTFDINSAYCEPEFGCMLDLCLCDENAGTDFVFDYTSAENTGETEEVFIVVDLDGSVAAVGTNSPISAVGLATGSYSIYGVIYDPAKAGNLVGLLTIGASLSDIQTELANSACGSISTTPLKASINEDFCECEDDGDKMCATDICPCNGDANEIKLSTTGYTGGDNQQWYVVVSSGSIVITQQANADGSVAIANLPDGAHEVYAVNYDPATNTNITSALEAGNVWSNFADGVNSGTYCADFIGPQNISINVMCDCGGMSAISLATTTDVSDITTPAEPGQVINYRYTVCNTGDDDLTDISVSSDIATVSGGAISLAAGTCDEATFSASYTITTENITNGSVVSSSVANGIASDGTMISDNDLATVQLSMQPLECNNNAGVMPSTILNICFGNIANAPTMGAAIDAGSTLTYVLHDGNATDFGSIIDYNNTGLFVNNGAFPTGIQLYICAVISPDTGSFPNLEADCTSISNCTPVTFLSEVEIGVEVDCTNSGNYSVIFEVSGGLPSSQVGGLYSVSGDFTGLVAPNTPTSAGPFNAGTFYTLNVIDNNGCSTSMVSQKILCEKLPIELISFSGEVLKQGNYLKWITANEIENDYFTLERSTDGVNFELISTQKGAGTSSENKRYNYLDREAPSGISYYKLWQTDFDGTISNYGMIELSRGEANLAINQLLPIPVLDFLELTYTSISESEVQLQIYDALGKQMSSKTISSAAGLNTENIDVSTYPSGMYFLTINQGKSTITEKFIKE